MANILVVTTSDNIYETLQICFAGDGEVTRAATRQKGLQMLHRRRFDFVFIDLQLLADAANEQGYHTALQEFRQLFPTIEIIVVSSQEKIRQAVEAVRQGASNYLTVPLAVPEVKYVVESIIESKIMQSELDYLRDRFWKADSQNLIKTNSPVMKQVFEKVRSVAPTISTVLLIGDTGTGKGVLAKIIHHHSQRSEARFISIHCGAIPDTLLESELFGHERGAFTGASRRKLGKFEIARDGTIFLDEIATLTPSAQVKLLQILQDKVFQRLGGEETIETNARIIAATNMDLKEMCDAGLFRKDLYYRLNVFPIEVPSLAERKEDIPLLVDTFIARFNKFHSKSIDGVEPGVLTALGNYSWPGNIRELENLIERAFILEESSVLSKRSFPVELFQAKDIHDSLFYPDISMSLAEMRRIGIENLEKTYLRQLLLLHKGKINHTAAIANISSRQLHKLMKKYDLHKEHFK
jgi:DNA-binding NtrC family response regulator